MAKGGGGSGRGGGYSGGVAPMSAAEMRQYRNYHDTSRMEARAASLTAAQRRGVLKELRQKTIEAEEKARLATERRPSYAPAGRLTRSERGARAAAELARDTERFWVTILGKR